MPAKCGNAFLLILAAAAVALPMPAFAYRPFDGTDAAVAAPQEFELELGPAQYFREGDHKAIIAPAVIANFGIEGEREIVLEGKVRRFLDNPGDEGKTSLVDTALSLKQVHRRGSLQGGTGVSIASECGILLPSINAEPGAGFTCAGIASQQWSAATVHFNVAVARTREHEWDRFVGLIVEGPSEWPVRPVMEVFNERDTSGAWTNSALVGMIWRSRENLSFDFAVRSGRSDGPHVSEVRAGLTWGF